jgi:hypothetical protein
MEPNLAESLYKVSPFRSIWPINAVSEEKIFLTLANQKKDLFLVAMFIGQMERNGETL